MIWPRMAVANEPRSQPMKLKTGCIFWPEIYQGPVPQFAKLEEDIRCDVAIIGGGISGALAAYHLTKQGVHTVLLDRRSIAEGSTGASTGLLLYEIDTLLIDLIRQLGHRRAVAAYRASLNALKAFEPLVADLADDCGLVARPSLYLASDQKHVEQLQAECDARKAMQIDVKFLSREALESEHSLSRPAALLSASAFEVDPYRLTLQLIARSVQRGLEVYTGTQIVEQSFHERGGVLRAANGSIIDARKVVFATGYETMEILPPDLCTFASTFALASQPVPNLGRDWPKRFLIWESARPYLYARTTIDDRIIVGGEDIATDEPDRRDSLVAHKSTVLCRKFAQLMPQIHIEPVCCWAGTFAQTSDSLPYVGSFPGIPHAYFALGYGGNGITFSLLAGELITQAFLGQSSEQSKLFGFDRSG